MWLSVLMALFVSTITTVQLWSIWVHCHLFKRIRRVQKEKRLGALATSVSDSQSHGHASSSAAKEDESAKSDSTCSAVCSGSDDSTADSGVVVEVLGNLSCEEMKGEDPQKDDKTRDCTVEVVICAV